MKIMNKCICVCFLLSIFFASCKNKESGSSLQSDTDILQSEILEDSSLMFPALRAKQDRDASFLGRPNPIIPCGDTLTAVQLLAQQIAISNPTLINFAKDAQTGSALRSEVFSVMASRPADMVKFPTEKLSDCFRVEMYVYPKNLSVVNIVNATTKQVLAVYEQQQTQPDIPIYLKNLAIQIAINNPNVQKAYGIAPTEKDALMASTKTALNRTRCERSRHLCVAPTFVKDGKALWVITDLTDLKVVGLRWTNTGAAQPNAPITERRLQDDKITACFCEKETKLTRAGWNLYYMLTNSDGLRISDVTYKNQPILQSAKLVDWHVSYSGTDGFGYSDAVGCPTFSQAAVIAFNAPEIATLNDKDGKAIGFVLEQAFKSELWPQPCNYNYRQRYEFYDDGRFRVAAASVGRGCGNDGTYRPVFRIAFAEEKNNVQEWAGNGWKKWSEEQWKLQDITTMYNEEGYQYQLSNAGGNGFFMKPGNGNFVDAGRGDNAHVYVTKNKPDAEEGEADLITIGPCCNTDFQQGPEKFILPNRDPIENTKLVLWYVAQLKNDDRKGNEYCWAESKIVNGQYVTQSFPCFAGPMFFPTKK